jgi:hypothetical protein
MRATWFVLTTAAAALVTAGCAGSSSGQGSAAAPTQQPAAAASAATVQAGPSAPAQMICSNEIAAAVKSVFVLTRSPARTHAWSGQTYRCDYRVGAGTLHLSVADYPDRAEGNAFFAALRARLPGAARITGPANFGFPAFQTPNGNVAFLKDGKTLRIDASALPAAVIPADLGRLGSASSTAAAVLECWTE